MQKTKANNAHAKLLNWDEKPEKFVFSHNPEFDEMFDEHGNFAPPIEKEVTEITEEPKNP
ncbi:hypothetical protein CVT91_05145 [Candidatus Atribacteria bacterium HGW-Atribacteria-1]|nr:MAG: hypothetical protein CVT91_05145 [Candidatus Atribacteria bacterium HGW-Atribacteria-1]